MSSPDEHSKCEIILDNFSKNPHCPHGPSVLFSRGGRKFFACAAYRSRHLCPFFLDFENAGRQRKDKSKPKSSHRTTPLHSVMLRGLGNPEHNDGQAQFFFSQNSTDFFLQLLRDRKPTRILSLGTPSIHQHFQSSSHLLDIDRTFESSVKNFSRYNMCNHYFFINDAAYRAHLKMATSLIVICDPPFGARLELLFHTFRRIEEDWGVFAHSAAINFIFIHPYFSEGKILKLDTRFRMSDYKVEYATHKKFNSGQKSPVRFFTTLDLSEIRLPGKDYKYCRVCRKWVFALSKHCLPCASCDSKDGKLYHHCEECKKCVKQTWAHCLLCSRCHLSTTCPSSQTSRSRCKKRKRV